MPKKTQALATRQETGISLPSYMGQGAVGKEGFRNSDLKLPYLRLAQKTSPVLKNRKDIKEGDFYNSVTMKNYGPNPRIVPLVFQFKRAMFEAFDEGGGLLCSAPTGDKAVKAAGKDEKGKATNVCKDCVFKEWTDGKNGKKPPKCNEQGAYLVIVEGDQSPCILILQRTSWPTHRNLTTMITQSQVDIYGNAFKLGTDERDQYRVITAEADGYADEKTYNVAKTLFAGYAKTFSQFSAEDANKD